ncbi:hypothetical protein F5Y13DRAFT_153443 [Hypoxylon sp. FL1857]|nr:hypothetical protein F5Y13DRAFT_153443 [Hypoxylon sp. FL1857]
MLAAAMNPGGKANLEFLMSKSIQEIKAMPNGYSEADDVELAKFMLRRCEKSTRQSLLTVAKEFRWPRERAIARNLGCHYGRKIAAAVLKEAAETDLRDLLDEPVLLSPPILPILEDHPLGLMGDTTTTTAQSSAEPSGNDTSDITQTAIEVDRMNSAEIPLVEKQNSKQNHEKGHKNGFDIAPRPYSSSFIYSISFLFCIACLFIFIKCLG